MVDVTQVELRAGRPGQAGPAPSTRSGTAEATPDGGLPTGSRPGVVLAVVPAGVILTGIDLFIVNVALPEIGAGLQVRNIPDLSWLLSAYTSASRVIAAGCGLFTAGIVWWHAGLDVHPSFFPHLLVGLVLTSALPPERSATEAGLVIMVRQLGLAVGVAVLVAVMGTGPSDYVTVGALQRGWTVTAIIAAAAPLPALLLRRRYKASHRRGRRLRGLRPARHRAHGPLRQGA